MKKLEAFVDDVREGINLFGELKERKPEIVHSPPLKVMDSPKKPKAANLRSSQPPIYQSMFFQTSHHDFSGHEPIGQYNLLDLKDGELPPSMTKELDIGMEIWPKSFALNLLTSRLAVWNKNLIKIIDLNFMEDDRYIMKVHSTIRDFNNIKEKKGVVFLPNGKGIIVFEELEISLWLFSFKKKDVISKIECKGEILWSEFFSAAKTSTIYHYEEYHANTLLVAIGWPDATILRINIPSDVLWSHNTSPLMKAIASYVNSIELNSPMLCQPREAALKYKVRFIPNYQFIWTAMAATDGLLVRVLKVIFSDDGEQNLEYELMHEKTYQITVDVHLMEKSTAIRTGMVVASTPMNTIYYLNILETGESSLTELFTLPSTLKKINNLFYDKQGFILITANDCDTYLYSKVGAGDYGLAYITKVLSPKTTTVILRDLSKIMQVSENKVKTYEFAPFKLPLRYYYASSHYDEKKLNHSNLLTALTKNIVVSTFGTSLLLESITAKKYIRLKKALPVRDQLLQPTGIHLIDILPQKRWILFVKYSKTQNKNLSDTYLKTVTISLPTSVCFVIKLDEEVLENRIQKWFTLDRYTYISFGPNSVLIRNDEGFYYYEFYNTPDTTEVPPIAWKLELQMPDWPIFMRDPEHKYFQSTHFNVVGNGKYFLYWNTHVDSSKPFTDVNCKFSRAQTQLISDHKAIARYQTMIDVNDSSLENTLKSSLLVDQDSESERSTIKDHPNFDSAIHHEDNESNKDISEFSDDSSHLGGVNEERPARVTLSVVRMPIIQLDNHGQAVLKLRKSASLHVNMKNRFLVSNYDGNMILVYGQNGYELLEEDPENYTYKCIRRRWRKKYSFSHRNQALFSPGGKFLIMALVVASEIVLLDLKDPRNITSFVISQCLNLNELKFYFKFFPDRHTQVGDAYDGNTYLAVPNYFKEMDKMEVKVFDVERKYPLASADFSPDMIPTYFELKHNLKKTLSLFVLLSRKADVDKFVESGNYGCIVNFTIGNILPMEELLRFNIINYYLADNEEKKHFSLEMLTNTLLTLKPYQIIRDVRLFSIIYMLNLEGILESLFTSKLDIEVLFENLNIPKVVFNKQFKSRKHSALSVANLAKTLTKEKGVPCINPRVLEEILSKNTYLDLCSTRGAQVLFMNLLLSPCFINVKGHLKQTHTSFIKLNPRLASSRTIHPTYLSKKVRSILDIQSKKSYNYQVYRSRFRVDLTNGSRPSIHLMQVILSMPDDDIKSNFKELIRYKWNMIYKYSLAHTIFYYIMALLSYLYFSLHKRHWVGYIVLTMNGILLLFDWTCLVTDFGLTKKDPMIWLDAVVNIAAAFSIIWNTLKLEFLWEYHHYYYMACIVLISLRGLLMLKTFRSMRVIMTMVFNLLFELRFMPIVFLALMLVVAATYRMTPTYSKEDDITFMESLEDIIKVAFVNKGNVDDLKNPVRAAVAMLGTALLANGIFYMSLSIMLQTYKKMAKDRKALELRSLIMDIKSFDLFLSAYFRWLVQNKGYFLMLKTNDDPEDIEEEAEAPGLKNMVDGMVKEMAKRGLQQMASYGNIDQKKIDGFTKFVTKEAKIIQKAIPADDKKDKKDKKDDKKDEKAGTETKLHKLQSLKLSEGGKNESALGLTPRQGKPDFSLPMKLISSPRPTQGKGVVARAQTQRLASKEVNEPIIDKDEDMFDTAFDIAWKVNNRSEELLKAKDQIKSMVLLIQNVSDIIIPGQAASRQLSAKAPLNPTIKRDLYATKRASLANPNMLDFAKLQQMHQEAEQEEESSDKSDDDSLKDKQQE